MMQVLVFLADTAFFVLVFVAMVRAWLNAERISMAGQPGTFIMALTNWLVMPLRRALPRSWQRSRWDIASLVAAGVLALVHSGLLMAVGQWAAAGASLPGGVWAATWVALAAKLLLRTALQGALVLVLGYAVLSWVQPHSYAFAWLHRLVAPLLRPLQRVIPLVGGVDLSALALVLLLQIGLMLVG